ncbi:hypothetical protein [Nostoc sp. UIC 10630]|uniref:hypothetical protein n=1 Tax=Nostoc sp. UIC 10630 TaxID=2100146 RepID=UPI0013D09AF1|nr:hypothetical protein [Nostoc sp. UIC 10630]NEU82237.1 hypothetical protein [Nostoc sp. UIC 10630]
MKSVWQELKEDAIRYCIKHKTHSEELLQKFPEYEHLKKEYEEKLAEKAGLAEENLYSDPGKGL